MPKTGFYCVYGLKDTTALQDSTPASECNQEFGNLELLKENTEPGDYATLEKNFFLLDASQNEMPDEPEDFAFYSNAMSGGDGTFSNNPCLNISFTENHSSIGFTFYFKDDYPLEMDIVWYDIYGIQIASKYFEIDSNVYFARNQVENYAKVKITFTKARPCRYVKLWHIEYGTDLIMGEGGMPLKGASLIEETDRTSDKIAINKLSYKLIDTEDDFNVGNISGLHKVMQKRQKLHAYEVVNGNTLELGTFFLDDVKTTKNVTSISAVDFKGVLDDYTFKNGKVYDGELAGNVIDEIMTVAGIEDYEVDDEVRSLPLYGWLKIQTCRKALREVLFACGAVAESTRRNSMRIFRPGRKIQTAIERTRKFSTSVSYKDYISDVSIKYPEYFLVDEEKQIVKGVYNPGIYTVELSFPAKDMVINTGEIIEQSYNYVQFKVAEQDTEIVIKGKKYSKDDLMITASVPNIEAGKLRKTKSFTCTVLSGKTALERAEEILDYYSLQIGLKIKFLNQGDAPGMWGEIQNNNRAYGNYLAGIEKMTTDLTGGFISTAELRGYYKLVSDFYYTGELIAGEDMGVL
ncbi:MAG: hypothetical protein IJO85_07535 [Lachnospiraceae bacterium]|nr:hypothetical protein [Lachnospiraceae bacterium]